MKPSRPATTPQASALDAASLVSLIAPIIPLMPLPMPPPTMADAASPQTQIAMVLTNSMLAPLARSIALESADGGGGPKFGLGAKIEPAAHIGPAAARAIGEERLGCAKRTVVNKPSPRSPC